MHTVSTMKPWVPLFMIFLCVVLLSRPAEMVTNSQNDLEECWGKPNVRECARKCSRTFKCARKNHKCCWTSCGNICWENDQSYEDMPEAQFSTPSGFVGDK